MKSTAETQTALCIAGAHRSGTSMVTRLLHCCGLELGPEWELMPQEADNPDGFWEHLGFVALNDELLNELGARGICRQKLTRTSHRRGWIHCATRPGS
jgi:hypothetical protein